MILFGQNKKHSSEFLFAFFLFFVCMYKIVVEITKETWEKCGIKTVKHYNKKEDIIALWQKGRDLKKQIKQSNICDIAFKRIKKLWQKNKNYHGKRKTKI